MASTSRFLTTGSVGTASFIRFSCSAVGGSNVIATRCNATDSHFHSSLIRDLDPWTCVLSNNAHWNAVTSEFRGILSVDLRGGNGLSAGTTALLIDIDTRRALSTSVYLRNKSVELVQPCVSWCLVILSEIQCLKVSFDEPLHRLTGF